MAGHPEDAEIVFFNHAYTHFTTDITLRPVELDLGCGAGSFTAALAAKYPERTVLAADVMLGRLRKVVRKCHTANLKNMTVLRVEARYLLGLLLPDKSLSRIHLLCPDPWPKTRHRGNRLLCSDFATQLHRVLVDDGVFHFASDDEYYCDAVNRILAQSGLFALDMPLIEDIGDIRSDFEQRWLDEGKFVSHRAWRKLPLPKCTIGH